jgi:annexin A7/11
MTQPGFSLQSTAPGFSPTLLTPSPASYLPTAPHPQQRVILGDEFVYLGTVIPNPDAPPLALFKPDSQSNAYRVSDDYHILKSAKNRISFGWDESICKY